MAKAKVRFVEGADVALADFMEFLGDCLLDGAVESDSSTELTITGATTLGTLTGEDISLGLASTGTVHKWVLEEDGAKVWTISKADLDVASLTAAAYAEGFGEDLFAFEEYYFAQTWNYRGTDAKDVAKPGDTTSDGYEIDFLGNDVFDLRGGNDAVGAGQGNDKLKGGTGRDRLWGEEGRDKLFGQGGSDKLWGGSGKDKLVGGAGDDALWGGGGKDVFKFKGRFGDDTVKDFGGKDLLDLRQVKGVADFKDVKQAAENDGDDLLLDFKTGSILIEDMQKSDLDADMFLI